MTAAKKAARSAPNTAAASGRRSSPKKVSRAAKKAASPVPKASAKRAAPARKLPAVKKAAKVQKAVPATKKASASRAVPVKKAAAVKKPAPVKKAAPVKKTASANRAAAAPAKKAPPTKKAVVKAKKAAPAAPKRPTVGPYAKDQKFLDEQRALLLDERSVYAGQATDLRAEADSLALEREPGDVQFDEESGEGGTVTVDRERNLALSAQALAAVEEIDDALRKIDRKTYGACERCHQPIPKARLRALPFARLCVACKSGGLSRR